MLCYVLGYSTIRHVINTLIKLMVFEICEWMSSCLRGKHLWYTCIIIHVEVKDLTSGCNPKGVALGLNLNGVAIGN